MCKDCGVQKVMEIRVQCPHQEEQKFVLQDFVFDFFFPARYNATNMVRKEYTCFTLIITGSNQEVMQ
jgi:hypothetical protein